MEISGVLVPSMTNDWCTTDSCWDSTLDPCTFPLSSDNPLDIAIWSEDYQNSPAPALEPVEASILDRVRPQLSISTDLAASETTCRSHEVEVSWINVGRTDSCLSPPSQIEHGSEHGPPGTFPKARRGRRNVKKSSQDYWEQYRSIIKHLYLDEEKCLEEVMQYMREQFGFLEKIPAYKRKLNQWGISKNIRASHMNILAAKARKRKAVEGKDTHFYVHERLLDPSKLIRFNARKSVKNEDDFATRAATPPYVRYFTPSLEPRASTQSSSPQDMNYSFCDNSSSTVQTPQSFPMVYSINQERLQNSVNNDLPIRSIELPEQDFPDAGLESDFKILENSPSPRNKAEQYKSPLIPRLPCGIFKPPLNGDASTGQAPSRTVPGRARVCHQESSGNPKQDTIPQTCNWRPETAYSHDRLSQKQMESLLSTTAVLENVKDMILYHYGPENELFLQHSLGLGLLYQKLLIPSKYDKIIADLGTGYSKFSLPVDSSQWTEDDLRNFSLPLSEYICCAEPVLEHCTCNQLRELARRNQARMSRRDFKSLQSRAIACYLRSGRTGQALDSLLDLEDMFDPLVMEAYFQSIFEVLENYSVDFLHWNRFIPFMQRAFSSGNHNALSRRLHAASHRLWIAQKIPLAAHLQLLTCHPHLQASNALAKTEDELIQQIGRSNGNEFLTQIRIMRDVQAFTDHYREQGQEDTAEAFVLRVWEKCKDCWGLYSSETLHAQQLVRGLRARGFRQIQLAPTPCDGAMVFDRSFG